MRNFVLSGRPGEIGVEASILTGQASVSSPAGEIHRRRGLPDRFFYWRQNDRSKQTRCGATDHIVDRARRELALMEAEAIQQTDPIVDAILGRLAELEPHQKATAAKTERLSELTENAGQIRQLIYESRQVERKLDLLEERKSQLVTRLREQNLRTRYLEQILERYESSLKKATTTSRGEKDE